MLQTRSAEAWMSALASKRIRSGLHRSMDVFRKPILTDAQASRSRMDDAVELLIRDPGHAALRLRTRAPGVLRLEDRLVRGEILDRQGRMSAGRRLAVLERGAEPD